MISPLEQLSFDLWPELEGYKERDLVITEENAAAVRLLESFFAKELFKQDLNPDNCRYSIILKGDKYSGKTHLLKVFSKKFKCQFIDVKNFSKIALDQEVFYIFEGIDDHLDQQHEIQAIINYLNENGCYSIFSLKNIVRFDLQDLISRLKNIFTVEILPPSPETTKQLIIANLSKLQISLPGRNIDFIAANINRSYEEIWKINQFIATKPGLTISDIKEYLAK